MSKPIIQIEDLGKRYLLGTAGALDTSFREMLYGMAGRLRGKRDTQTTTRRNELWALRHANFEVQPGEVVGVIGPNGSGKSTLLKILSRITSPTEGRAMIRGRLSSLLEVGTGFHPELTGKENIYLNGSILGMRKREIDAKFDQIVAFSGVEAFLDTPVKRYSSGMYVRLAFAVAAHLDPEILLIDEVLAVGDAAFQQKCLGKMRSVARSGRTVLFVSHNMGTVDSLCNRAILLNQGEIVTCGQTASVIADYMKLFGDGVNNPYRRPTGQPDTSPVTLTEAATVDLQGHLTVNIAANQPFAVRFACRVNELPPGIRLDVHLRDFLGRSVFAHKTELHHHIDAIGSHGLAGEFTVPADFLTKGKYHLQFLVHRLRTKTYEDLVGICGFTVTAGNTAIGRYGGEDFGCVQPPGPLRLEPAKPGELFRQTA